MMRHTAFAGLVALLLLLTAGTAAAVTGGGVLGTTRDHAVDHWLVEEVTDFLHRVPPLSQPMSAPAVEGAPS